MEQTKHSLQDNINDKGSIDKSLPIKISRKKRKNYTQKRNNYKNYAYANWNWHQIYQEINELEDSGEHKYIRIISKKYNINYKTLKNKYSNWSKNKDFDIESTEQRGGSNKLFTEKEEEELYNYINDVYIKGNLFFDDECLRLTATKKLRGLYGDNIDIISYGWVYYFKKRWKLSSFIARNTKNTFVDNDEIEKDFLKEVKNALKNDQSLVFNLDETFWRILNGNLYVIGLKGSPNRPLNINFNEKEGFSAVFLISADGNFHKPVIILKGKTNRIFTKTGLNDDSIMIRKYSGNGWINYEILKYILEYIASIANGKQSYLILDQYPVHTDEKIKEVAKELLINLIYVPAGKTAQLQPLDISINGPIKALSLGIIKEEYLGDPFKKLNLKTAVNALIEAKSKIKNETVINSFKKLL